MRAVDLHGCRRALDSTSARWAPSGRLLRPVSGLAGFDTSFGRRRPRARGVVTLAIGSEEGEPGDCGWQNGLDCMAGLDGMTSRSGFLSIIHASSFMIPSPAHSIELDPASLLDPYLSDPWATLQMLLQNPWITISLAVALYYFIPRLTKITVKFVVTPVVLIGLVALAVSNPEASLEFAEQVYSFVQDHPYQTSLVAVAVLGVLLSPYIIVFLSILVIVGGYQLIPNYLKPFAPRPLLQVENGLEMIEESTERGLDAILDSYRQSKESVSDRVEKALVPILEAKSMAEVELDNAIVIFEETSKDVKSKIDVVTSITGDTVESLGKGLQGVSSTVEQATKCTKEGTTDLRRECVRKQNEGFRQGDQD